VSLLAQGRADSHKPRAWARTHTQLTRARTPCPPQDANKLVEEFMLLANISVAKLISSVFPERALLRCVAAEHT